jgi:hypothetical protein
VKKYLLIPCLLLLFQCATTQSESFVIDFPALKPVNKTIGLHLYQPEAFSVDKLAEKNDGYFFGGLKPNEIVALNHSVYGTLVKNRLFRSVAAAKSAGKKIDLEMDWMLRDYTIVAAGSQVWGAANISYCFVNSNNEVVFQEEFSVATKNYHCLIKTVKTQLNSAIVNRLVIQLANWYRKSAPPRLALPHEYNGVTYFPNYREATQIFPPEIKFQQLSSESRMKHNTRGMSADRIDWSKLLAN